MNKKATTLGWCAFLMVIAWMLVSPALAQRRGKPPEVQELEAMVIEGKVAKPTVFYVLGRSTIRYEGLKMDRSFVRRIVDSARRNPF